MAPLPAAGARHRPALGRCGCRPIPTCASTPTTTRWIPALVGRRVEVRVTEREVLAVALDTGELACRHPRSFARHRTITALEHARALAAAPRRAAATQSPTVEIRSLDRYDQLIA